MAEEQKDGDEPAASTIQVEMAEVRAHSPPSNALEVSTPASSDNQPPPSTPRRRGRPPKATTQPVNDTTVSSTPQLDVADSATQAQVEPLAPGSPQKKRRGRRPKVSTQRALEEAVESTDTPNAAESDVLESINEGRESKVEGIAMSLPRTAHRDASIQSDTRTVGDDSNDHQQPFTSGTKVPRPNKDRDSSPSTIAFQDTSNSQPSNDTSSLEVATIQAERAPMVDVSQRQTTEQVEAVSSSTPSSSQGQSSSSSILVIPAVSETGASNPSPNAPNTPHAQYQGLSSAASQFLHSSTQPYRSPYQHSPYQHSPYQHSPYQHTLYQHNPYQHSPYQKSPYQSPYQNTPYQHGPYQQILPASTANRSDVRPHQPVQNAMQPTGLPADIAPSRSLSAEDSAGIGSVSQLGAAISPSPGQFVPNTQPTFQYGNLPPPTWDSHQGRWIAAVPNTQSQTHPDYDHSPTQPRPLQPRTYENGNKAQNSQDPKSQNSSTPVPKKRGRPKKQSATDDAAQSSAGHPSIAPKIQRKRKAASVTGDIEESLQVDGTPIPRKKRAYNKKKKPSGPSNQSSSIGESAVRMGSGLPALSGSTPTAHPLLLPKPVHQITHPRDLFDSSVGSLLGPDGALPDFIIESNVDQQMHSGPSDLAAGPNGHHSGHNEIETIQNGTEYSRRQQPSLLGANATNDAYEEDYNEEFSGNEEGFEDNAVYSHIMSQVTRYTGKPGDKPGGKAKRRLEDFLGFTETADEEMETDTPDAPVDKETPKQRKVVKRRGPRVAAEPTPEIKMRLGLANEAFQESNIEEARRLCDEIIQINSETYEAWNLLSSIFEEQGSREDALMALIVAAHLRPKHVEAWFNAADYALTSMGPITPDLLRDIEFCLSSAVRLIPSNIEARIRKAQVLVMREHFNKAATDYKYILRTLPNNIDLIRELGAVYIDLGDGTAGVELFQKTFERFKNSPDDFELSLDWNDLHSLAVLYSFLDKGAEALKEIKAHARWLLGREDETFWDDVVDNDCEWDVDDSRRSSVTQYSYGNFPLNSYGEGLPIELRVYFGKFRLKLDEFEEANKHFSHLLADDQATSQPFAHTYPDLMLDVAESLFRKKLFKDALRFYHSIKQVPEQNSAELCIRIGKCLIKEDDTKAAEQVLREACLLDESNIEARVELARLYENMDEADQARVFVNQILQLQNANRPKVSRRRAEPAPPRSQPNLAPAPLPVLAPKSIVPQTKGAAAKLQKIRKEDEKLLGREAQAMQLREYYMILKNSTDQMRSGSQDAIDSWMDAARALTEDFRSCAAFYPWDRKEFGGYSPEEQKTALMHLNKDVKALAEQREQNIGSQDEDANPGGVPNHYRGITFREWVEIFCEYALCLARRGRGREAYDICEAATHAICFCFSKNDMFTIYLTYAVCALMSNDEETCVALARWFMAQYQFATDSYRMFAALMRMCHTPISWYSSGPTQKFILRHIKAVDYTLSNPARQKLVQKDKASYSHMDQNGKPIINKELDIHLLMIYGHILIAGASYLYALNYFHRALTQDPDNPAILLALGLSYMQYALKRQIENRQHTLMQGFAFLHRYYGFRSLSPHFVERQEAHYNMARAYHLVGLTNLAVPFYRKVLRGEGRTRDELGGFSIEGSGRQDVDEAGVVEDMCMETAYNLQVIYSVAGNHKLAEKITRKWLVI